MEAVWASEQEVSVQDVCDLLGPGHHYKTVMTIMSRLTQKGLLVRRLEGRAHLYRAGMPRKAFLRSVADSVLHGVTGVR